MSEARSGDQIRVWVIGVNNAPTGKEPHFRQNPSVELTVQFIEWGRGVGPWSGMLE